jgi:hypothetical protein
VVALPRSLTEPLLSAGTTAWRLASAVRGERAVHAKGRALTGQLTVPGGAGTGARLLDEPGSYDVVVRLSRAIGLPDTLPDIAGLAVRVLDAYGEGRHQDLLLDSTLPQPLLRHLPWPQRHARGTLYSSLLPYDAAGRRVLLGARPAPGPDPSGPLPGALGFELLLGTSYGPWQPWGLLQAERELPAPLGRQTRFDPWVTGGGLRPAGPLQELRRRAYAAAQVADDAVPADEI